MHFSSLRLHPGQAPYVTRLQCSHRQRRSVTLQNWFWMEMQSHTNAHKHTKTALHPPGTTMAWQFSARVWSEPAPTLHQGLRLINSSATKRRRTNNWTQALIRTHCCFGPFVYLLWGGFLSCFCFYRFPSDARARSHFQNATANSFPFCCQFSFRVVLSVFFWTLFYISISHMHMHASVAPPLFCLVPFGISGWGT